MRQSRSLKTNPGKRRVSMTTSVPAPYGGWNARDPLANMKPTDAIILDDLYPTAADVQIRLGSDDFVTGLGVQVESLMVYSAATTDKMFAFAGSRVFDVSTAGAQTNGDAVVTGLTNARWYHINLRTAGGAYLYAFNGVDSPLLYDGATWTAITGVSTPAITGITTSNLIHPNIWKRRIFLVEKESMSVWYLPVDAVGGAASQINFGPLFRQGGYILATATYTLDGGEGMDDHLVIITSKGEIAVYKGTDPSSATTFALVGIYHVGTPIGRRCFVKVGGDLAIITTDGVMPLAQALVASQSKPTIALTDKIRDAFNIASQSYKDNFGWEGIYFPSISFVLFNIPLNEGSGQHQYVMNSITQAWCRFTAWSANCFAVFDEELYFGSNGKVVKAWTGQNDNGSNITTDVKQAFNYFGKRGQTKHFSMIRPIFAVNGNIGPVIDLNVDFEDRNPLSVPTFGDITDAVWDVAVWDTAVWGGALSIIKDWQTVLGVGYCAALRMKLATNTLTVRWVATDYVMELGEII